MPYYEVSIPLRLKTLTYYYKEDKDLKGFAVEVPLKNRIFEGIVLGKSEVLPEGITQIKEIKDIIGKAYSNRFIDFLDWLSKYNLSEIGSVLRLTFFEEILNFLRNKKIKARKKSEIKKQTDILKNVTVSEKTVSSIVNCLGEYKAFLIKCPNISYQMKLMIEVAKKISSKDNTIFILPEITDACLLFAMLREFLGERVVLLHSEMTKSELLSSIYSIMEDKAKVVVGTRSAIFAPLNKVSLIMIMEEGSFPFKEEQTPRYNAREASVMRAFLEKCPVVLMAQMPSTESYFNVLRRKYHFIDDFERFSHPQIKILKQPYKHVFHPDVLLSIKMNYKEGLLITTPRSGYSLLICSDCGSTVRCEKCGYSMIFSKSDKTLECFRCNVQRKTFIECPYCGSTNLTSIGIGVERIVEELRSIFPEEDLLVKDFDFAFQEIQGVSVLQTCKIKRGIYHQFKCSIIVDFDFFLCLPDYRATEEAFKRIMFIVQLTKQDGTVFIQTNNPENRLFKFIRDYNFKDFYLYELKYRKEAGFPPFVRLVKLVVELSKRAPLSLIDEIKEKLFNSAEVLGPFKTENERSFVFILRFKDKTQFIKQSQDIIKNLQKFKSVSFSVEVDPVSLKI